MESDYKFRYVNEYITNLLEGNITLQYEDIDLKGEKKTGRISGQDRKVVRVQKSSTR